jgi:hypothetical protein
MGAPPCIWTFLSSLREMVTGKPRKLADVHRYPPHGRSTGEDSIQEHKFNAEIEVAKGK